MPYDDLPQQAFRLRTYLQIVENRRKCDKIKQQVITTLGRLDRLQSSGQLGSLLRSGARSA